LGVDPDDDGPAAVGEYAPDAVAAEASRQERLRLRDDLRIPGVERDPQPLRSRVLGNVAVAEVQT
jgi:hypothetical protein